MSMFKNIAKNFRIFLKLYVSREKLKKSHPDAINIQTYLFEIYKKGSNHRSIFIFFCYGINKFNIKRSESIPKILEIPFWLVER